MMPESGVTTDSAATPAADRPRMAKAVARHGGLCCLCGRPCGPEDARRHSEPGAFGDGPQNFAAMCRLCRAWLDQGGPAPARYVVHLRHGPGTGLHRLQRAASGLLLVLLVATGLGYLAAVGYVLHHAAEGGPWHVLGAGMLIVATMMVAGGVVRGWRGERPPVQRVHHTFEAQIVEVREPRAG